VDPQKVSESYVQPGVNSTIVDRLSTLQQQIMSPTRLKRTIDMLGLYPELRGRKTHQEIVAKMQAATSIDDSTAAGARLSSFKIGFTGDDPIMVARVANQLAQLFISENSEAREAQFSGTAEFLNRQLQDTKVKLEAKEQELQRVKSTYILDLPESKQYHMEALQNLRTRLQNAQDQVSRSLQDKAMLQAINNTTDPDVNQDPGGAATGYAAAPYAAQIQQLEAQLTELKARYAPNHPDIRRVQEQLNALRAKATAEPAATVAKKAAGGAPANQKGVQLAGEVQRLDREIQQQKQLQVQIQQEIQGHTSKLEGIPVIEEKVANLMRDHETLQRFYNGLLDKKLSAEMAAQLETHQVGERFVVLDPASPPMKPFGPKRRLFMLVALVAGFTLGVVAAIIAEVLDESVRNEREAASILGVDVLVGVPEIFTTRQQRVRYLKAGSAWLATAACSIALGFIASQFSARWF
jgi:polysaccharide chain length determinant protein (PEP-CTERM system associated)